MIPKLYLKKNCKINGAHFDPEIIRLINIMRVTAPETHDKAVWITSANDSVHKEGSLHYENRALDWRISNLTGGVIAAKQWKARAALALGGDYDIILESDHIHTEYDPKSNQESFNV